MVEEIPVPISSVPFSTPLGPEGELPLFTGKGGKGVVASEGIPFTVGPAVGPEGELPMFIGNGDDDDGISEG